MKYLKIFETVSEMEEYKPTDEMISYVSEHDKCHVKEMYKICSFTMHLEQESDLLGLFAEQNPSVVHKITINGKPINMDNLFETTREGTYFHVQAYSQYDNMIKNHIVYNVPTHAEFDEVNGIIVWHDFVDAWLDYYWDEEKDMQVEDVKYISDDSLVMITYTNGGETIVRPLHFYMTTHVDDLPNLEFWFRTDEDDFDTQITVPYEMTSVLVPYEIGDYEIALYSFDENIVFGCGAFSLYREMYLNYTLSRNITKINNASFGGYVYYLTEIWYEGTMDEFNAIQKSTNWNRDRQGNRKTISTVHCADGDLNI